MDDFDFEKTDREWKQKYDAPEGHFWLCLACGKWGLNRVEIGDEACMLNAALFEGTRPDFEFDAYGNRVMKNKMVETPTGRKPDEEATTT